jgi:hypothetical protein
MASFISDPACYGYIMDLTARLTDGLRAATASILSIKFTDIGPLPP